MNRIKVKIVLLCFSFMLFGTKAYSPPPPPGEELPIDGGLSWLLVSGVAYGIYALKRRKKE